MDTSSAINKMLGKKEQDENDNRVKKIMGNDVVGKVSAEGVMNKILGKESKCEEEKKEEDKKEEKEDDKD